MGDDNVTAWVLLLNKDNDGHCLFDCRKRLLQDLWETAKAFISSIIHSHFGFCCFYSLLPFCHCLSLLTHLLHPLSHAYLNYSLVWQTYLMISSHSQSIEEKKGKGTKYFTCMRCYVSPHTCHSRRLLAMWALWPIYHVKMAFGLQKRRKKERKKLD